MTTFEPSPDTAGQNSDTARPVIVVAPHLPGDETPTALRFRLPCSHLLTRATTTRELFFGKELEADQTAMLNEVGLAIVTALSKLGGYWETQVEPNDFRIEIDRRVTPALWQTILSLVISQLLTLPELEGAFVEADPQLQAVIVEIITELFGSNDKPAPTH